MTDLPLRWSRPVDGASLSAFRVLFGLLMVYGAIRFVAEGWVEKLFGKPDMFLPYWGFGFVQNPGLSGVYGLFFLVAVGGLGIALGLLYRFSVLVFLFAFTWIELIDVTNYLNHHYLAWLLGVLCLVFPLHQQASIDAWRKPSLQRSTHPAWVLGLFRLQLAVVYFGAAIAKTGPDWLLHGQPLGIWLSARTETPVLGALFAHPYVPILMSWGGFLYDATIVFWLSWSRSRPFAYLLVLIFHGMTAVLFDIGLFPPLMTIATLLFFPPSWPRRVLRWLRGRWEGAPRAEGVAVERRRPAAVWVLVGVYVAFQVLFPLRTFLYGGNVLWHEQGMRWSWRVMVRAKAGSLTYHVRDPVQGRTWEVSPSQYLTWRQWNEMAGQPDLILRLAHIIADDFRARGHDDVEVRVDAIASLNGRPPAPLIDPAVDLAKVRDGIGPASYVLPAPATAPLPAPHRRRALPPAVVGSTGYGSRLPKDIR